MTTRIEPTLTIGPDSGDLRGADDRVLQAGIEYLNRLNGGVLRLLPGVYTMRNALYLRPNITLQGSGPETVLKKAPSTVSPLIQESDWYESRVRVENPVGFSAGSGLLLRGYYEGGYLPMIVVKDTITAVEGDTLSLSKRLDYNFWPSKRATAATLYPLITAEYVDNVTIENLTLDGNRNENDAINGNYAGGVFLQHCDRYTLRNVISRNYNGDGFSFQVCDDIRFENCVSENNANLGFHPGSGSQRPVFSRCVSRGNGLGLFFCWGVSDGLAEECILSDNLDFGVSIGHRDTDNKLVRCTVERNAKVGVLFREDDGDPFVAGHRTVIDSCLIRDNGVAADGVGVDVRAEVYDTTIRNCRIEDSGQGLQRVGVRIGPKAQRVHLEDNHFTGVKSPVQDLRHPSSS